MLSTSGAQSQGWGRKSPPGSRGRAPDGGLVAKPPEAFNIKFSAQSVTNLVELQIYKLMQYCWSLTVLI